MLASTSTENCTYTVSWLPLRTDLYSYIALDLAQEVVIVRALAVKKEQCIQQSIPAGREGLAPATTTTASNFAAPRFQVGEVLSSSHPSDLNFD